MPAAEMEEGGGGGGVVEFEGEGGETVSEGPGGRVVEAGERLLRQVLSSDTPTILTSELPPWRPRESVMKNTIEVPWATLTFHA